MKKRVSTHLKKRWNLWVGGIILAICGIVIYYELSATYVAMHKDNKTLLIVDTDNDGVADATRFTHNSNYRLIDSVRPPQPDEQEYFQKHK